MLVSAIIDFYKFRVVGSIIVLANWTAYENVKFARQLSQHGMKAICTNDPSILDHSERHHYQGVIYIKLDQNTILQKVKREHFSAYFRWLVIGDGVPSEMKGVRYDADITLVNTSYDPVAKIPTALSKPNETIYFENVLIHPRENISIRPWAEWSQDRGFQLTHEYERILRRVDVKRFPLKIATPVGHYSEHILNGTFAEYLADQSTPEKDSAQRCSYEAASLIVEALNATAVLIPTLLWSTEIYNSSMYLMISTGAADLSGAVLRPLHARVKRLDYVMPIWPFSVGFTYLAERESSSNMYVEPFSKGVWLSCLGLGVVLSVALRVAARGLMEKEGAYIGSLATWLQQDASAVPEGITGRWVFLVLSIASMLVHAYYTSAIVSALMSCGKGGPDSLKALADSRYAIASEDYDYMKYSMFGEKTNWTDMEYLKKKKMTANLYQSLERGVELVRQGNTAYHSEYNTINLHLRKFSDEHVCKLAFVDTIPEMMSWLTSTKHSQWTDVLRSKGALLHETGLAKRILSRWRFKPPPCRSTLLAERVKFGDVLPALGLSLCGAILAFILLGFEILIYRLKKEKARELKISTESDVLKDLEYID